MNRKNFPMKRPIPHTCANELEQPAFTAPQELPKAVRQFPKMTLTVEELMDELNISRPTAYELVKQESFPAFHIGQRILINRSGLQDWLNFQCQSGK